MVDFIGWQNLIKLYQIWVWMFLAFLIFCNLAFQDGRHLSLLKLAQTCKWQYLNNLWIDSDQIYVKMILLFSCLRIK